MSADNIWPTHYYKLPDGRVFLVLSVDYDNGIVRLAWMTDLHPMHQDVYFADLRGYERCAKPERSVSVPGGRRAREVVVRFRAGEKAADIQARIDAAKIHPGDTVVLREVKP